MLSVQSVWLTLPKDQWHNTECLVSGTQLGLFGSTVRGENTPSSDIDVLIDFMDGKETYVNFMSACQILEDGFDGTKVDVVTKKGLSPYIGKTILNEVEYV